MTAVGQWAISEQLAPTRTHFEELKEEHELVLSRVTGARVWSDGVMEGTAPGPKGRHSLAQPIGLGAERGDGVYFQGGLKGSDRGGRALDL